MQLFDGSLDYAVIMEGSANKCDVGPLAIRQLSLSPAQMCKRVICIYVKNMFDKTIFDKNISFTTSWFDPLILRLAVSARNHCAMESSM